MENPILKGHKGPNSLDSGYWLLSDDTDEGPVRQFFEKVMPNVIASALQERGQDSVPE
jgi:hypothetical protein